MVRLHKFYRLAIFILLFFLSLFPRSIEALSRNYVFGFDQGRDMLAVWDIVVNHKLTLIGAEIGAGSAGFSYIFHGPFYYYSLCLPFILFGGDPYGGVVLMLIFGLASIIAGFFIGKKIFNRTFGIILAFLLAVSPALIPQSRFIWNSHPTTLFILLLFYLVYKLSSNKSWITFSAAFLSGFIYNFELGISLPLSVALIIYSIIIFRIKNIKQYLFLFLGFILAFLPMIVFEARHNFSMIQNLLHHNSKTDVTFLLLQNLARDHLQTFYYGFANTYPTQNIIPTSVMLITLISIFIYFVHKDKNILVKKFFLFLLCLPIITFIVFSIIIGKIWLHYLIHLNIAYIFISSYVVFNLTRNKQLYIKLPVILISLFFIFIAIKYSVQTSISDYKDYGGMVKVRGEKDSIDYIYKDARGKKFGLLIFSPAIYTYQYDYLIKWYGFKKYGYLPYSEKKGTFYLLIQQDLGKPWTYKGWLETVVKSGKVVSTVKLPSGLIVQKRSL